MTNVSQSEETLASKISKDEDKKTTSTSYVDENVEFCYHPLEEMSLAEVFNFDVRKIHQSMWKTSRTDLDEVSPVPSECQLSDTDPTMTTPTDQTITITLNETETIILFELPQKVEDARTEAGEAVKAANERYEKLLQGDKCSRQITDDETQTINARFKSRATQLSKCARDNCATFVNNWIMFDEHQKHGKDLNHDPEDFRSKKARNLNDELEHIYYKTRFREAVRVILRILSGNIMKKELKIYKGLIEKRISNAESSPTYELELLWIYSADLVKGRIVSTFACNPANGDVMAVGYGPVAKRNFEYETTLETKGFVLLWCAKNPLTPEFTFEFQSPVSALDWSKMKCHWLAVGLYNGVVQVIDVSGETLIIVKQSENMITSKMMIYKPHWRLLWWSMSDEESETQDLGELEHVEGQIYAANQDGRILRYSLAKNFEVTEVGRFKKIGKMMQEIRRDLKPKSKDPPIFDYAGALVFERHPLCPSDYFVGSNEGYVLRNSNYSFQCNPQENCFAAHHGPIYQLEFSPFLPSIFVTCGVGCARIWCDSIFEPLVELKNQHGVVKSAVWCPTNATILATCTADLILLWDLARKSYEPMMKMKSLMNETLSLLKFKENGRQLMASDMAGNVFMYQLKGMPVANFDQRKALFQALDGALKLKTELRQNFRNVVNI